MTRLRERAMAGVFLCAAIVCILATVLLCLFLLVNGIPGMQKIGLFHFLLGTEWTPTDIPATYGILPMIVGSLYVTAGAILLSVPVGVLCAIFLARVCPRWFYRFLKPGVDLLAGIPSVVYGFFGLTAIVPRTGNSILSACLLLGMMILPTIITVGESAVRAIPEPYYQGARALGAGHYPSVFFVLLPAAKSGILACIVLGIGRAVGETMAVVMVAGNQPRMPTSLFAGARTLTANIVLEMGYASQLHREALIATGVVLFVFILLLNLCLSALKERSRP